MINYILSNKHIKNMLEKLRNEIDQIDNQIILLLEKRLKMVKNIKKYKKTIQDLNL